MSETSEKSNIPEDMPPGPDPGYSDYVTIEQAAFIMQKTPETLREWIEKGLLMCLRVKAGSPIMIHQSELDRFRIPWRHIWRIDHRISALQGLLEVFKQKILGFDDFPSRVLDLELDNDRLESEAKQIQEELGDIRARISKAEVQPSALTRADVMGIFSEMFCGLDAPLPVGRIEEIEKTVAEIKKTLGTLTKELLIERRVEAFETISTVLLDAVKKAVNPVMVAPDNSISAVAGAKTETKDAPPAGDPASDEFADLLRPPDIAEPQAIWIFSEAKERDDTRVTSGHTIAEVRKLVEKNLSDKWFMLVQGVCLQATGTIDWDKIAALSKKYDYAEMERKLHRQSEELEDSNARLAIVRTDIRTARESYERKSQAATVALNNAELRAADNAKCIDELNEALKEANSREARLMEEITNALKLLVVGEP